MITPSFPVTLTTAVKYKAVSYSKCGLSLGYEYLSPDLTPLVGLNLVPSKVCAVINF